MSLLDDDIRVVVSIDFGTTYSGYAYAHKSNPNEIIVQENWEGLEGHYKTPTVIKYDEKYKGVKSWGFPALAEKPSNKKKNSDSSKPIELFKLHLIKELNDKPFLPEGLEYKKVITDYLGKLAEMVKISCVSEWQNLDFYRQVLTILTVPAEFDDDAISTMRECAFNARLTKDKFSRNLKFTTEPEAAAIYCLNSMKGQYNLSTGASFMIVDCGGGTVDLTTRQLLDDNKMSEVTERTGDNCGSSFIDQEFVKLLGRKLGKSVIEILKKDHYSLLQYIVQEFCRRVKIPFTGQQADFKSYDIDLDDYKLIKQYVTGEEKNRLEESDWSIEIEFEDIKAMFDPIIGRIIRLIRGQLEKRNKKCSALMLTGGFGESRYLQARIRQEFGKIVPNISVPIHPIIAIIKGGVQFGLQEEKVVNRVLKRTYGTDIARASQPDDPASEKFPNGLTIIFDALAKRGEQVPANKKVIKEFEPCSITQQKIGFNMYVTRNTDAKFCNDPGVSLLRNWEIELPRNENIEDMEDTTILFTLSFGSVEILATAENQKTSAKYHVSFKCE
ncbi:unnamed protein product [Rhizophagus irregularis]|uniref:Actin-like ATPase domain-containing protein n=1 Tax=Rhizophagus irregularis TaxID=588596 RepID=A0A2N1NTM3_9GLOM|nr:actin-like ATPase domain-containing protein [Rhizophagus irregularis]CAB4375389.1 unnamed protein product [Rhizophagus irregularis]